MWTHSVTHATLLARLAEGHDPVAWREFCERYARLIRGFAKRHGLQPADCDEVVQDTLLALAKSLHGFRYDPSRGKFRAYLKTVALHEIYRKIRQKPGAVELDRTDVDLDPSAEDDRAEALWEAEWRQHHLRQAMCVIRAEFSERDRNAFQAYAVCQNDAAEVAESTGLTVDQVYQAKSRILKRLGEVIEQQIAEEG